MKLTPLGRAMYAGQAEIAKLLEKYGASFDGIEELLKGCANYAEVAMVEHRDDAPRRHFAEVWSLYKTLWARRCERLHVGH